MSGLLEVGCIFRYVNEGRRRDGETMTHDIESVLPPPSPDSNALLTSLSQSYHGSIKNIRQDPWYQAPVRRPDRFPCPKRPGGYHS